MIYAKHRCKVKSNTVCVEILDLEAREGLFCFLLHCQVHFFTKADKKTAFSWKKTAFLSGTSNLLALLILKRLYKAPLVVEKAFL